VCLWFGESRRATATIATWWTWEDGTVMERRGGIIVIWNLQGSQFRIAVGFLHWYRRQVVQPRPQKFRFGENPTKSGQNF